MVKILNGRELADYIKERQARQVRGLRQAHSVFPKVVIVKSPSAGPVIDAYVRMKQRYGADILVDVVVEICDDERMIQKISELNADSSVHAVVVQLPLARVELTDEIVNALDPAKDVDGLGAAADYMSATAEAISWLLAGYNIDLVGKKITLVGNGRLVGAPLARLWRSSGLDVTVVDSGTVDMSSILQASDIIVTATGTPRIISTDDVAIGAVVVDAGTASEGGAIVGDVDEAVRERSDVTMTPEKGGVGPLTISALFDHVIQSAHKTCEGSTSEKRSISAR